MDQFQRAGGNAAKGVVILLLVFVLSLLLASFHPQRDEVKHLAEIRWLNSSDVGQIVPSAIDFQQGEEPWDDQISALLTRFSGDQWIIVRCESSSCEKGWDFAKRLQRFGFPKVAIITYEAKPH